MALDPDVVLLAVEAHLLTVLGHDSGRASVSFLGTERLDVLRFGPDPDGLVRYVTLGMSRAPMGDPGASIVLEHGPRAELVLSVRDLHDTVLRRLAALASSPGVEGLVISPGASLDLGEPLWDDAAFQAVLVGEPGGVVPDLDVAEGEEPVRFLPLFPMTPNEAAWKRVHGAQALEQRWLDAGTDLRDPVRAGVRLDLP
ncbi:MAG: Suppressor of fused domain protein [Frankiales bacterium]|nr:Suppressor of fused domain protein [Frankiales bacterium]